MKKIILIIFFLSFCYSGWCGNKIFILSSYDENDVCGSLQYKGILNALETNILKNISIENFYINSRHLNEKELENRIKKGLDKINKFQPDILMTIDDLAFKVTLDNYLGNNKMTIVFSGVNQPIDIYNKKYHFLKNNIPVENITGVYENIFAKEAIQFLETWIKEEQFKIAALFSTDEMGQIIKNQITYNLKNTKYFDRLIFFEIKTLQDINNAIKKIKANKNIKLYLPNVLKIYDAKNNKYLSLTDLIPMLIKSIKIPEMFTNIKTAELGFLGGLGTDFFKMGTQAGLISLKVLEGYEVNEIPIEKSENYKIIINIKRAKECNLPINNYILNIADEVIK